MQTQTQTSQTDILQQFANMLKSHSIVVSDRENLVKLLENIVELCTQMPKTKLKAAVKAASKPPAPAADAKKAPAKKAPAKKNQEETLVGPENAGDCPMGSDIVKPAVARRGRPRKTAAQTVHNDDVATPAAEAEKKKRGRPKKDKTLVVSSNDDEDELIAQMIADVKSLKSAVEPVLEPVVNDDDDATDTEDEDAIASSIASSVVSLSPVVTIMTTTPAADVSDNDNDDVPPAKTKGKGKVTKPKEPKEKATKTKEPKEPKEKATKVNKNKSSPAPAPAPALTPVSVSVPSPAAEVPTRENKAGRDGKFYLMPNFPRSSFTYNGKTYLRTETDNVYDNLTLEMIGVWDHLNHEIITAFDEDEDVEDLLMSDDEE